MGLNLLQSKPLTQISLPVRIFDSKSFLEKIALFFKTAPILCGLAATVDISTEEGQLRRFKLIVAFAVSIR